MKLPLSLILIIVKQTIINNCDILNSDWITAINAKRSIHKSNPIYWNDLVSIDAQKQSDESLTSGNLIPSDFRNIPNPKGPAQEILQFSKTKLTAQQVVELWQNQISNVDSYEPFKCASADGCDDFTALIWDKVDSIGCGCSPTTNNGHAYICRIKAGDNVDMSFPNSMKPSNQPDHVQPIGGKGAKMTPGNSAPAEDEKIPKEIVVKLSINMKPIVDTVIEFNQTLGNIMFTQENQKQSINALNFNPIQINLDLLKANSQFSYYDELDKEYSNENYALIKKNLTPFLFQDGNQDFSVLEFYYQTKELNKHEIMYMCIGFDKNSSNHYLQNMKKLIDKEFSQDKFDLYQDVQMMGDNYAYNSFLLMDGKTTSTQNLYILQDGSVKMKTDKETLTLIPSLKATVKDCLFQYKTKTRPEEVKLDPSCCINYTSSNGEDQYICSNSGNQCVMDAMLMVKKLKLACEGTSLKSVIQPLKMPSLLMQPGVPLSAVYPYQIKKAHREPSEYEKSPQYKFDMNFESKEEYLNQADDDLIISIFSERDQQRALRDTKDEKPLGSSGQPNSFSPKFMQVESIQFKNGKIFIEFKDFGKKQIRNLTSVRIYNHADPDPEGDEPEEVNGGIFDSLHFYNQMSKRVLAANPNALNLFRTIMIRTLGSSSVYNRGMKCSTIEFENPMNTKQELIFLCYCNPLEIQGKCLKSNFDISEFSSIFSDQMRNAYYNSSMSIDLRLLRNNNKHSVKQWDSGMSIPSERYNVRQDDLGVKVSNAADYLFKFKEIDDSKENALNKCQIQQKNHEHIELFKNWHSEVGENRECCHRFTTAGYTKQHQVCAVGVACLEWNRLLIKKTIIQCYDAKKTPVSHDPPVNGTKFITEQASIQDRNQEHQSLNFLSGIRDAKLERRFTLAVKVIDLTNDLLYKGLDDEIKSTSFRHFYYHDAFRFKQTVFMPEFYRFKETAIKLKSNEPRLMFMELTENSIRIFENPSDETYKQDYASVQQICKEKLLCDLDSFEKSSIKTKIHKMARQIASSFPPPIMKNCKVFQFLKAAAEKRSIFLVCPESLHPDDVILKNQSRFLDLQLKEVSAQPDHLKHSIPYALNTFPFMLTVKSNSVVYETPTEMNITSDGLRSNVDGESVLTFENCNCQAMVGFVGEENCIKTQLDESGTQELITVCMHMADPLHARALALLFAKKLAVDCSRFKDPVNDIHSIETVNQNAINVLMTRRPSVSDIDGNKQEAFGPTPSDLHLPVMIMTFSQTLGMSKDELEEGDEDSDTTIGDAGQGIIASETDIDKGSFVSNVYSGELGVNVSMIAIRMQVDNTSIMIGERITESIENLVWPCRDKVNPCSPEEFFQCDGYDPAFLVGVKSLQDKFKSDDGIATDELCIILAFQQNRIVPVCFVDEKEMTDFNAIISKNQSNVLASHIFKMYEPNKKPWTEQEYPAKILSNGILQSENLKMTKDGITKADGTSMFEFSKVKDSCSFYYRQAVQYQPPELKDANYQCCERFKQDGSDDYIQICLAPKLRCQVYLKWFMRSSQFQCGLTQDITPFEMYPNDPSVGKWVQGLTPAAPTPSTNSSSTPGKQISNPLQSNIDQNNLRTQRETDASFQHFKQTNNKGDLLEPEKCKRVEIDKQFGQVRGWWFDRSKGRSMTGSKSLFMRVANDEVCLCPNCRVGFEKQDYKDEQCECWKLHNLLFKCHLKQDVCNYQEFSSKLGIQKEYQDLKKTVDMALDADQYNPKKENCIFLQFQIMFDFKEVVVCTIGEMEDSEALKLKNIINSSYPKVTSSSTVHLELPILSDQSTTRILIQDKDSHNIIHNGVVKMDFSQVLDNPSPAVANPNQLIKQSDIVNCKFEYKDQIFPDTTNFTGIPFSACCFSFNIKVRGNVKKQMVCHKDPYACIVPSRRVMYKMRAKCKENLGKVIYEQFNYTQHDQTKGFYRGWAQILNSKDQEDVANMPSTVSPKQLELDKKREIRHITNVLDQMRDEEENGLKAGNYINETYHFKQLDFVAETYHSLSPEEQKLYYTNKIIKTEKETLRDVYNTKLDLLDRIVRSVKDKVETTEHCIVVEQHKHDVELKVNLLLLCPQISDVESSFKFKWALTIAQNHHLINGPEFYFSPLEEENKIQIVYKGKLQTFTKPIWVKVDSNTKQLVNKDGGDMLLDLTKIKDNGTTNMCKMSFSNVTIPLDFIKEGYTFENQCCAVIQTDDGFETMCNVNKPRCFYKLRRFARQMRKVCIQDHAASAGLNLAQTLALEKYFSGNQAAAGAAAANPAPAYDQHQATFVNTPAEFSSIVGAQMIEENNPATTVLRKLTIKKVDDQWTIKIDEHPTAVQNPTVQDEDKRTLVVQYLQLGCEDSPYPCGEKQWMKKVSKISSPANQTKIQDMIKSFKTKLAGENLDPMIFKNAIVLEAMSHYTHSTKTWIIANADPTKYNDFISYISDRQNQAQTGSIRENIWKNPLVNLLSQKEDLNAIYFQLISSKPQKVQTINISVASDAIISKDTGEKYVKQEMVQEKDGHCRMEQNPSSNDLATLLDQNFENSCCISVTMKTEKAHFCIKSAFRCGQHTNRLMKTAMTSCNNFKIAKEKLRVQLSNQPIVQQEYLAYESALKYKNGFSQHLQLKYEQETKTMGVQFDGYVHLQDFKSSSLKMNISRFYASLDLDNFNLFYLKEMTKLYLKHPMLTQVPMCDISCNPSEQLEAWKNEIHKDYKEDQSVHINFMSKQLAKFQQMAKAIDDKSSNNLIKEAENSCQILKFEDIGTYIQSIYVICTEEMGEFKKILKKVFNFTSKDKATDSLKLMQNYNMIFQETTPQFIKYKRLNKQIIFRKDGIYIFDLDEVLIPYSGISKGSYADLCPVWQNSIDLNEASENGTKNPECCFKIVLNNHLTQICLHEDNQSDFCFQHKMKFIVTFKHDCVQYQEKIQKSLEGQTGGSRPIGGYNPLVPNQTGGFIGVVQVGKLGDANSEMWIANESRRLTITTAGLSMNQRQNGIEKIYSLASQGLEAYPTSLLDFQLDPDQKKLFMRDTAEFLMQINVTRVDKPKIELEDCLWVRHLSNVLNQENQLICPVDKFLTNLMQEGIKDSVYSWYLSSKDLSSIPEAVEGDIFEITSQDGKNGIAIVEKDNIVWRNDSAPIINFKEIQRVRGVACASWSRDLVVGEGYDANCCFSIQMNNNECNQCETSNFCIVKSKKLLNFITENCKRGLAGSFDDSAFKPKHIPNTPFQKNPVTKNQGWDEFLGYKSEEQKKLDEQQRQDELNGVDSNGINNSTNATSAPAKKPSSITEQVESILIDRKEVGQIRMQVQQMQLEELTTPVEPNTPQVLEVSDRTIVVKPTVSSNAIDHIESTMTSLWKIDCNSLLYPCTAKMYLELNKEYAAPRKFDQKVSSFIDSLNKKTESIEKKITYTDEKCIIMSFQGSLLTSKKKKVDMVNEDQVWRNLTTSLICPVIDLTESMQIAITNAFNRSMYLINPALDLPEVEEKKSFSVDFQRGGDKQPDSKLSFTDMGVTLEGDIKFNFFQKQMLQCKFITDLHKDELPDTKYKNIAEDGSQVSAAKTQTDCCIFFKMIDHIEEEETTKDILNNIQICSQDTTRCTQQALMIGKELQLGCQEMVEEEIQNGLATNPQNRVDIPTPNATTNKAPVGYKWVDDEGWVDIEKDTNVQRMRGREDFNQCADAQRFRKGGFKKFLHGEYNHICI